MAINIKLLIKHLIGFVLMTVFTYYVISYAKFEFEIPFLSRNAADNTTNGELITEDIGTAAVSTTEDISNINKIVNSDDLIIAAGEEFLSNDDTSGESPTEGTTESSSSSHHNFITADELKAQGFAVSDGVYEKYSSGNLPYEYAFGEVVPEYSHIPNVQTTATNSGTLNLIEPFMDFILIRRANNVVLCDSSGKIISESFAESGFEILNQRDADNNTVFAYTYTIPADNGAINENSGEDGDTQETEDTVVTKYFIYDRGMKSFVQIDYNPIRENRGVPFMYPSYYGIDGAEGISRYEHDGKWGYLNEGLLLTELEYDMAYNFSESIGIAYKIEQKGVNSAPYFPKRLYFLDSDGRVINSNYFAPENISSDHLGFFYFEKGLTRVYYKEFDWQGQTTVERDILIDRDGKEFYIPEDYDMRAYSNGVILLEKDGCYGFMSYTGDWIAQPIFTYAQPFSEGVAVIGFEDGKKALIDTQGNLIVRFQYDYISGCTGGTIALYEENQGWTILSKMRK